MSKMPWFPLFAQDYLGDTLGMSCCEHGTYCLLLMQSWINGPLTHDLDRLQRMAGNPPMEVLRYVLETHWEKIDVGWVNKKLEEVRQRQESINEYNHNRAKKAAKARWDAPSNAHSMHEHAPSNAPSMLTQNPEPRTQNIEPKTQVSEPTAQSENPTRVSTRDRVPYAKIMELWAEMLPELPQPLKLTPARKANIRARWQDELPDLESWQECFSHIKASPFMMGKVDPAPGRKRFYCTLDWITKQSNLLKLYEGKYDG